MAFDPAKAKAYDQAIAAGATQEQALAAAGITDNDIYDYSVGIQGNLEPGFTNPRPNETIVPAGQSTEYGEDLDVTFRDVPASSQTTTTSQTTVTGGGSRTTVVQPTQYQQTPASTIYQAEADRVAAEKRELTAQLKAEGKTSAQVLRDPRFRELSREQQSYENAAYETREPVPGTGGITVTDTPSADSTTTYQSSSPTFETTNAGIEDPNVETQEVAQTPAAVNGNLNNSDITDFTFEDNASLGYSEIPPDPEGGGIGIDYADNFTDTGISPYGEEDELFEPEPVPVRDPFEVDGDPGYGSAETEFEQDNPNIATLEVPDPYEIDGFGAGDTTGGQTDPGDATIAAQNNAITQGFAQQAREQQTIAQQRKNPNNGDWRVKLRLAPGANYLYKDPNAATGILQPLSVTDGVVFPYTPTIDTQYRANYSTYDLTHSNYRGYFYQNSYVDAININGLFTAQSTPEANYLLAVIHFFRSVTKMFYGQDAQRGTPPPLTYLSGLGEYQFNEHPCLVSNFSYKLPNDVDYIRAGSPNMNNSVNLTWARSKQSSIGGGLLGNLLGGALTRLSNAGLPKGGISAPPPPPTLGLDRPTYVPTKMEISITLLPVQSRAQVSKQFSVKQFANGDLLKGGFW